MAEVCKGCGQLTGVPEYDAKLWDIYERISDGRSTYEPLVFTGEWVAENVIDEDDHASFIHTMERDMANRGLCTECRRPDLRNVSEDMIMSEDEAREVHESWAIQAQERRMGA